MNASDGIQIGVGVVLTLTLGAVLWYAWEARRQAQASGEMAREMLEARHGTVLPVIDFVAEPRRGVEHIQEALAIKEGQFPETIHVRLRNIGLGPALDLHFKVRLHDSPTNPLKVGHVAVGANAQGELAAVETWHLYMEPLSENVKRLSVEYRDVYGRAYTSWRDVRFDESTGDSFVGPLHTSPSAASDP